MCSSDLINCLPFYRHFQRRNIDLSIFTVLKIRRNADMSSLDAVQKTRVSWKLAIGYLLFIDKSINREKAIFKSNAFELVEGKLST